MKKEWKNQISKMLLIVFIATLLVPLLPSLNGLEDNRAVAAEVYNGDHLATQAVQNNYNAYKKGIGIGNSSQGLIDPYDVYILSNAGMTVSDWVYDGENLKSKIMGLVDTAITKEADSDKSNDEDCKYLAYKYLAAKSMKENTKANQLLTILKNRQTTNGDGTFKKGAYSEYSNLPTFDALGRTGVIGQIDTGKSIEYVLSLQDISGGFPSGFPGFMSTTQAVRVLKYLEPYAGDKTAKVQSAIDNGIKWIKSKLQDDGSIGNFSGAYPDDTVTDTAEAIITLKVLGIDPATWKSDSNESPVDFMMKKAKNSNGTFGTSKNIGSSTWALDVYAQLGYTATSPVKNSTSDGEKLATQAVQNNYNAYKNGIGIGNSSQGLIDPYDVYILSNAGMTVSDWVYDGENLKSKIMGLVDTAISKEADSDKSNDEDCKYLAYKYLAAKGMKENTKANQLLTILKNRQTTNGNGTFKKGAYSEYSNLPTFDALGRTGVIGQIDTGKSIEYVLSLQDTSGGFPSGFPGFMSTTQAVRVLKYLEPYAGDKTAKVQSAINNGIKWIKSRLQDDGSVGNFSGAYPDDTVTDTAEAIITLKVLGIDPATWKSDSNESPVDFMMKKAKNSNGTFGTSKNIGSNTWALDVYTQLGYTATSPVENGGNSGESGNTQGKIAVTIKVIGKNKETLYGPSTVTLSKDDKHGVTAVGALDQTGLSYTYDDITFIKSIAGQANEGLNGWMYKVNGIKPSYSAINYQLKENDNVEWFYSTDSSGDSVPAKTEINYKEASKADENKLDEAIKKTGEAKLDIKESKEGKGYLPTKKISDLAKENKSLTIESKGVQLTFGVQSLMTEKLNKALEAKDTTIAIGAKEVTEEDKKEIIKKAAIGKSTGLFEIGGKIVDLSVQVIHIDNKGEATKEEKIDQFNESVKVTIDLSDAKLNKEDIKNLTGIRYEKDKKGNIIPKKLGGNYDPKTKTFTFYTDQFSLYGVLKAKDLVKIDLEIDEKNIIVNNEEKLMDVSPMIINDRTMVPVRFIAENMGADVKWIGETKTVEIMLGDKKLSLVIDEKVDGLDVPATIIKDRTFVPLRYVSEYFDANVLWHPSSKKVEIVK
jgi:hypothetical protein